MAITYTQTNSTGCTNESGVAVNSALCVNGGTAGSVPITYTIGGSDVGTQLIYFTCQVDAGTTTGAGTLTWNLNVTTSNMNLTLNSARATKINSACSSASKVLLGETTGLSISLAATGVQTGTISISSATYSAGDQLIIGLGVANGAMTNQTFAFTPNNTIVAPYTASANVITTPGAGAIVYSGKAPALLANSHPGSGSIIYAGLAPTPVIQQYVRPSAGAITYAGLAPAEVVTNNRVTAPGAGTIAYSGLAPTRIVTANHFTSPGAGTVVYSGLIPTINIGVFRSPGAGAIVYTGLAPTEVLTANKTTMPGAGAVTYAGATPTEAVTANHFTNPGAGTVTYTGQQPVPLAGGNKVTQPGSGAIAYAGQAPSLVVGGNKIVQPGSASILYTGHIPRIVTSGPQIIIDTHDGERRRNRDKEFERQRRNKVEFRRQIERIFDEVVYGENDEPVIEVATLPKEITRHTQLRKAEAYKPLRIDAGRMIHDNAALELLMQIRDRQQVAYEQDMEDMEALSL